LCIQVKNKKNVDVRSSKVIINLPQQITTLKRTSTMITIKQLDPCLQTTILYYSGNLSFSELGQRFNISKQAAQKRVNNGSHYLASYKDKIIDPKLYSEALNKVKKQEDLILKLRQQLILSATMIFLLNAVIERVKMFFPKYKLRRFSAFQKKYILDMMSKFQKMNGTIKDFAQHINKSPETLLDWKKSFELYGINGLIDKPMRPKNFGNKVPSWIRNQLIQLFLKFPNWTEYQYHCYIKYNPASNWYVSLPTIRNLKLNHAIKTEEEKDRIKKRWAFAQGTDAWTVDFTVIYKTDNYKLQLLTVSDCRSRFLFESILLLETSTELMMKHLEELFLKYGKPSLIKADNGPEFRTDCRVALSEFAVYLFNSPTYYGQFNGAHERIHRTVKNYITDFESHKNLTKLACEIQTFAIQYNHDIPHEYLNGRTPFEVYNNDKSFTPENVEIIKPYLKDEELRMKFTSRYGSPSRMSLAEIK
jgi:predicted DNA-binding protein YlxM (UPF0122 family)